jgi:NADH-quinone oxidoreductase subunit H
VYSDINLGLLYLWAISSLGAYGILCSGWSSNSKYSFLGSLRAAAQMISYEVSLGLIFLNVIICVGSQNLTEIGDFQSIASFFFFYIRRLLCF